MTINSVCGMFSVFFTENRVTEFDHVSNSNVARFNRFFHSMLDEGVYLAPSAFEAAFVSAAHDQAVLDATLTAADRAFAALLAD
jgi:glutamate-1-semialdehyde 2,1-aminomutase